MSSKLRDSKLIENCTSSIDYDAQVKSACEAFDYQMYAIIDDTGQVVMIPNIMGITDPTLVDILAWQFHVDFYDPTRDLEFRKRLVQMSIIWHKTKGTRALVQEVVDTYWPGGASLQEWFEYMSPLPPNYPTAPPTGPTWHDRYRFRILVNDDVIDPATEALVVKLIYKYKPLSRWPDTTPIIRPRSSTGSVYAAGYAMFYTTRQSVQIDAPASKELVTTGEPGTELDLVTGDDGTTVTVA